MPIRHRPRASPPRLSLVGLASVGAPNEGWHASRAPRLRARRLVRRLPPGPRATRLRGMSAPGETAPPPVPRRLEAGDWVVAAPWVRSLPGLGKLVEGDYDPQDGALLRARVEWTHGSFWLPVNDVHRVPPEDEL